MEEKNIKRLMPCLLILFVLANLMVQAFVTVSPAMADEFQISASTVSMIVTMSTIVLGVSSVIYGTLSDYIPVKKLLIFGLTAFVAGSVIGLVFQKVFFMVVVARAVQTVGQAALSSLYIVIASRYTKGTQKIKYFACFTACFQVAQALGVLAGGVIATYINWKMLFFISLISILFVPAVLKYAPKEEKGEVKRVDFAGILLFSAVIVLMTFLLNHTTVYLIIAEIIAAGLFLAYISINKNAFITPQFFKANKKYTKSIIVVFVVYLAQFAFAFLYTFIVSGLYNNSLELVSYILLPGYIAAAAAGALSGKTINRLGRYRTVILGILLIIAGLVMAGLFMDQGKLVLSVAGVIYFVGYNTLYSPLLDIVTGALPEEEVGRGVGINDLTINISSSIGVAICSRLMVSKTVGSIGLAHLGAELKVYSNIMMLLAFAGIVGMILFIKSEKKNGGKKVIKEKLA